MFQLRHFVGAGIVVLVFSIGTAFGVTYASRQIINSLNANTLEQKIALPMVDEVDAAPEPEAKKDSTDEVSLFFGGDVMLDRNVANRIKLFKDDRYPFLKIMDDQRFEADLQVINLEGPVTDLRRAPIKSIDFMFDPRFIPVLKEIGFDVISQANNHTLDQGRIGANDSRQRLIAAGLNVFGDESLDDDAAMTTTTVKGKRFAFVGFNTTSNPIDDGQAVLVMKRAREESDVLIAFMHWGEEYRSQPTHDQTDRARWLIDNGADIVIGGHPHWVESISSYKGKPIFYSLGNFVFDQDWSEETKQGLALKIHLKESEVSFDLWPIQIYNSQPYFVEDAVLKRRLADLAAISDSSLAESIKLGQISFPFGD